MQRRFHQIRNRGIIETVTINFEALHVRIRREQRREQVTGRRNILKKIKTNIVRFGKFENLESEIDSIRWIDRVTMRWKLGRKERMCLAHERKVEQVEDNEQMEATSSLVIMVASRA